MLEAASAPLRSGFSSLERILLLKRLPAVGDLPSADLAAFADLSRERFFPKGSLILREGEPVPAVHLIVEGLVEASRQGISIGRVPMGTGIGALGMMAGDPFEVDARAVEDTLTLEIETDAMLELFEDRFSILHHILRALSRDLIAQHVELGLDPASFLPPWPEGSQGRDLDLVQRIFFLRKMPVFGKASINALFEVSRALTEISLPAGTTLWQEGEQALGVFLVTEGTLLGRSASGLDFRVGAGFPLGAAESVGEVPRWYRAVTETAVTGLQGPMETLVDVFEDNFELARHYMAGLSRTLIRIFEERYRRGGGVPVLGIPAGAAGASLTRPAPPV